MKNPNYITRLQRNIRAVVEENGHKFWKGLKNTTQRQLYRIESGESIPSLKTLQSIADDLKIDMLELFRK